MYLLSTSWERDLLVAAYEGIRDIPNEHVKQPTPPRVLTDAYEACRTITAKHSKSFYIASGLLPRSSKSGVRALYAFCRTTDDMVDFPSPDIKTQLEHWRNNAVSFNYNGSNEILLAWEDARKRFNIPDVYVHQLIDGVSKDLEKDRYANFDELAHYSYGVASTVGLMSMCIVGYRSEDAVPYAVKLGVALQLTNILRDVAEDWERGRLYLPQDELDAFGVQEEDIAAGKVTENWRKFMQFQIKRARRIYEEAWPGIQLLSSQGQLAIAAAATFYRDILKDIEQHDYDVFTRRAHVSRWGKLKQVPGLWWRYR